MTPRLTETQRDVLDFLRRHLCEQQRPPSVREICAEFGYKSPQAASLHLKALVRKGLIEIDEGSKSRGIRLRGVRLVLVDE